MTSARSPLVAHWHVSAAFARALLSGLLLAGGGLISGRPALLVLSSPLLVSAAWSVVQRPIGELIVEARLDRHQVREFQTASVRATATAVDERGVQPLLWMTMDAAPWLDLRPAWGAAVTPPGRRTQPFTFVDVHITPVRWGLHGLAPARIGATAAAGDFHWGPIGVPLPTLQALPHASAVDARASAPQPVGLVGRHRSARAGDGVEPAVVRHYVPGDRLRRINWRASLRPGRQQKSGLMVTSTHRDSDTGILVVVDAATELGVGQDAHGRHSTLDVAVRAAAGIVEHFLQAGDRVGLQVLLAGSQRLELPALSGERQRQRVLQMLSAIRQDGANPTSTPRRGSRQWHEEHPVGGSRLIVVLSPLLSAQRLGRVLAGAHGSRSVVVLDTFAPDATAPATKWSADLAWRMRRIEHDNVRLALQTSGICVLPWRGPGDLDVLLRLQSGRAIPRLPSGRPS